MNPIIKVGLRSVAPRVAVARRFRSIILQKRLYSLSEKQLYGRKSSNSRVATLEKEVAGPAPTTFAPDQPRVADIVPLKQRSVEDRLNDPNLLFEGEDEIPSAHINMIKELDAEFRSLVVQAEEAIRDPDVQLYERVCHARTRMLELRWLANPEPPSPTNRLKLEADIAQMLRDTDAEFQEYVSKRYGRSEAEKEFVEKLHRKWERDQRKAKAAETAMDKKMLPLSKKLKQKMKEKMGQDDPLYQKYDQMAKFRTGIPGEASNEGSLGSVDKILAHRKMKAMEKRKEELASQGQTFADVAPEGIPIEEYARVARAAELGRSPLDINDLGIDDEANNFEWVEQTDPKTGKKKKVKKAKSAIEVPSLVEEEETPVDEKTLEQDIEEAMRMAEEDFKREKTMKKKSNLSRDGFGGDDDPAYAIMKEIERAKSGFAKRYAEWEEIEAKRKKRLELAKAYTNDSSKRST